jgi:Protein of unknown function (DUF1499)
MNSSAQLPRSIKWTAYVTLSLLIALPLSILTVRSGAWQQGLLLFALCCLGATLAMIIYVVLALLPRYAPWRGQIVQRAMMAVPGTVLLALLMSGGGKFPPIHDITTDIANPPQFSDVAVKARGEGSNSLETAAETLEQQQQFYPGLKTLLTETPIEKAFATALSTATEMGWEVYSKDLDRGTIEAVDTTAIMSFKDDIVIRLRTNEAGTLIDLRSVSRVGVGDMGANNARIEAFLAAYQAAQGR